MRSLYLSGSNIFEGNEKIGYVYGNEIRDANGQLLGYFSSNNVFNSRGSKVGYLDNDYICNAGGSQVISLEKARYYIEGSSSDEVLAAIYLLMEND